LTILSVDLFEQEDLLELYDVGRSTTRGLHIEWCEHLYRVVHGRVRQCLRTAKVGIFRHLIDSIAIQRLLAQPTYTTDISRCGFTISVTHHFEIVIRQHHVSLCEVVVA